MNPSAKYADFKQWWSYGMEDRFKDTDSNPDDIDLPDVLEE